MSIRTTKVRPAERQRDCAARTANGKRKFMSRQRIFQKGWGTPSEAAELPRVTGRAESLVS